MAFIGVGGDGSVAWVTDVDNVREKPKSDPKGSKGHRQEGVDLTDPGEYFTVCIKLPRDNPDTFLAGLRATPAVGGKVCFKLLIEPDNPEQIRVDWKSKP